MVNQFFYDPSIVTPVPPVRNFWLHFEEFRAIEILRVVITGLQSSEMRKNQQQQQQSYRKI